MNRQQVNIIGTIILLKFFIHMFLLERYGIHRDEYLYLAEGDHLAWGYLEIPPFLSWLSKIILLSEGGEWMVKLLPCLIGCLSIYIIGKWAISLGAGNWALGIACLGFCFLQPIWEAIACFSQSALISFFGCYLPMHCF